MELRLIKVSFQEKDKAKVLGARWESELKCWYIPQGTDPKKLKQWWCYLECPFEEKDEARKLGAKWDKYVKKWYVPETKSFDDFETWWPAWVRERLSIEDDEDDETERDYYEVKGQGGGTFKFPLDEDFRKTGGSAQVYFGWRAKEINDHIEDSEADEEPTPSIAVKFFYNDPDHTADFTMFERELDALKKLSSHPNIVDLIDYGFDKTDNTFFIVTEYHALTLGDLLFSQFSEIEILGEKVDFASEHAEENEQNKLKTKAEIWLENFEELLEGVLNGLICAFDNGIMHRDLKPGNILIAYSEEDDVIKPLLIDFGIASKAKNLGPDQETVFWGCTNLYTPGLTEDELALPATRDVYSFGVIAIEMLSKEQVRSYRELNRVFEDLIEPIFPKPIVDILCNCISPLPEKRPKNVKKLLKLLQKANDQLKKNSVRMH